MKMFAIVDGSFMFRFEAEPGQPENENHKVIPTYRAIAKLGLPAIQELIRRFLSKKDIVWSPFDFNSMASASTIYNSSKHGDEVGISPSFVSSGDVKLKVVWVLTKEDIEEVNGVAPDGNSRTKVC